ncbi:Uncharacterized conserved protein, DUF885 familyt [Sphingomonas sp. YR710]|uniref:DUF885 domain-containing protein n=1 Tax=Sphingomonas sp. YR710 TaxID=1882773 RepID=UPI00089149FC|nr:DUF885 domain-containing protein [Sphingomonas sp. YR710]SDC53022.1 Uncharacterized conserved protein, DUF885 familyt [Sphingomonas sp. YR710]
MRRLFIAALLLSVAMPAAAAPVDDLQGVVRDHWAWFLKNNPIYATIVGVHDYDDQIGDYSLAEADREAAQAAVFIKRLDAIPSARLAPDEQTNKAILRRLLSEQVEANGFGERMMTFSTLGSWFQNFAGLADNVPMRTKADFRSYLTRLALFPKINAQELEITRQAVAGGYMQPCVSLDGFEKTITGVIAANPEESRFYAPFKAARPFDVSDAEWAEMKVQAKTLISGTLNPEYRKIGDYYRTFYYPKCRQTFGAAALPDGARYYDFQIRQQTTTTLTADQIHKIGLDEVTRIRAEMDGLAKKAGYASRQDFIHTLRTDPRYYPKSATELMGAAALQAKINDGKMPGLFATLPRLPYGVRAIPAETAEGSTTAYYLPGSPPAGIAGTYYVNISKLDQRPLYELPALTAHEAVPGHHNQIALQQELNLPEFRKYIASFTAFVEGWGLYSEHLGIEMGIYDTPEKDMGRLSYEMWRACRLVVDTGLHAQGWTKAQAVSFMKENTALTDANIDAEVNRYISNPGQALAYKLGELRILSLRHKAESALGPRFDVRRFHDAVLGQGPVPLDVLEAQIDSWIAQQLRTAG